MARTGTARKARKVLWGLGVVITMIGLVTTAFVTAASATPSTPVLYGTAAVAQGFSAAAADPTSLPGANLPGCHLTAAHPRPVVLVEGTGAALPEYQSLVSVLNNAGYCVYAANYGDNLLTTLAGSRLNAFGEISRSALELAHEVDAVLARTGASQVDLVGHSQGGMMPNYYLKFLGGAAKVGTFVALAPSNHGSDFTQLAAELNAITPLLPAAFSSPIAFLAPALQALIQGNPLPLQLLAPAIGEQQSTSAFQRILFATGDTVPGPRYVVIETDQDHVITPFTNAFLSGPNVTNILIQDQCPKDPVGHIGLAMGDSPTAQNVVNQLGPRSASFTAICTNYGIGA